MNEHVRFTPLQATRGTIPTGSGAVGQVALLPVLLRTIHGLAVFVLQWLSHKHGCNVMLSNERPSRILVTHAKFIVVVEPRFATSLLRGLFSSNPEILLGEGFMYGRWHVAQGALEDVLSTFWNIAISRSFFVVLRKIVNQKRFILRQTNTPDKAERNAQFHYDTDNPDNILFRYMLGEVPCYSSAIFDQRNVRLADAQRNKIDSIARALRPKIGEQILDIGCGWGVLTRRLAFDGSKVTGITLSREQLKYCNIHKLGGVVGSEDYQLSDYRNFFEGNTTQFDKVTCIEVLDHIGKVQFDNFFRLVHTNLKNDGTFFLQLIARPKPGQTAGWIEKYIYPGGYIASLQEVTDAYEKTGFAEIKLVELSGAHYAETLRGWRDSFNEGWKRISRDPKFDQVFYRKWMFFFAYSISAFENAGFCNYHLTLQKRA